MKVLFISPDIEESARGINFILKSLILAAKHNGHEVGILSGYPEANGFKKSQSIASKIEHLHLQHYIKEGRNSFRYIVPGGYRKRNILQAALRLSLFQSSSFQVNKDYLAGDAGWLKELDFVIKAPYVYQFMTRNWKRLTRRRIQAIIRREKIDCVIVAAPSIIRKQDVGRAKLIHFVHDTMPFELIETPPDNNTPSRYAEQFYSSVHESDIVFTNSRDTENKVKEVNPQVKTHILYGAPSSKISKVSETSVVENLGLDPGRYLVFVSTVEKRKNVAGLLEAYAMVFEQLGIPLVIVGGPGYGFEAINKKYLSLPLEVRENILFTGYVSEEDKYTLLKNAHAFVFPSFYEGFGLIIVEALAAGIPVLTSAKGALPEAGGNAALYIKNPYNVSEISEKLLQITEDNHLRQKLLVAAEKQVITFSQEQFNKRLQAALSNIEQGK